MTYESQAMTIECAIFCFHHEMVGSASPPGRGAEGLPSWNAAASGLVGGRTWRLAQGLLGEMMGGG